MNRILFEKPELLDDGTVRLSDNRAKQIREVLRAEVGAVLKVGMIDGLAGRGEIVESAGESVRLSVTLDTEAPAPWFDLLLAVPRPKVLKRLWAQLAALGAGRIVLLNAARVERVYFDSHWLREEHVRPLLIEGLTQCGATQLPEVSIQRRFRPFVEDDLDAAFPTLWRLAAHPGPVLPVPAPPAHDRTARPLLAIGPEGGWTPFEREMLAAHGFQPFSIGERVLRSDTACLALISILGYSMAQEFRVSLPGNGH
jgi:RsmE family RNA methyltransferase